MQERLIENLREAAPVLQSFLGESEPVCAIILGSGLNEFANELEDARYLAYGDVPHMKCSTATGHVGRFVLGKVAGSGVEVLCMQGRLHGYEGNSPQEVAFPVWLMHEAGIHTLLVTNAVGAINPSFKVGEFCIMTDQINLTGRNPLVGVQPNILAERFVPMLDAYSTHLREELVAAAQRQNVTVQQGVYLGVLGPSFETPAEIRAFATLGADTVAMSVVEEVIAARHVGMEVAGMSLITNMACGVKGGNPVSDDIMDVAARAVLSFGKVMRGFTAALAEQR